MPQRKSSFARALMDAEKRLSKALAEQEKCRQKACDLAIEIPALQHTIRALQMQLHKQVPHEATAATGEHAESPVPVDLSGMGSTREVPQDDGLPEIDGIPLTEE